MIWFRVIKYTHVLLSVSCALSDPLYEIPGLFGKVLIQKYFTLILKVDDMCTVHHSIYMLYMLISRTYINVTHVTVYSLGLKLLVYEVTIDRKGLFNTFKILHSPVKVTQVFPFVIH